MLVRTTQSGDAMLILEGAGDVFGNRPGPPVLRTLYAKKEPFALEVVSIQSELRFYMRTPLGRDADLQRIFVPSRKPPPADWLHLDDTRIASYRVLHLREHALLPAFGLLDHELFEQREAFKTAMIQHTNEHRAQRLGIRTLLQAAPDGWNQSFVTHLQRDNAAPKRGFLQRLLGSEGQPTCRPEEVDQLYVDLKSKEPGFSCEVQVVAVCKDNSKEDRIAQSALDDLAELVLEIAGGDKIWELSGRRKIKGTRIPRDDSNGHQLSVEPWPLLEFKSTSRSRQFPLAAEEFMPLWPTPRSAPRPAAVETVTPPAPVAERPPAVEPAVSFPDPISGDDDSKPTSADTAVETSADRDEEATPDAVGPKPVCVTDQRAADTLFHSAQPRGLPAKHGAKRNGRGLCRSSRNRDTDRAAEASESARSEFTRELGLTDRHILAFDQLGDLPWSSAQEFAACFGRSHSTVYDMLGLLAKHGLVADYEVGTGASAEKRSWVLEEAWDRIMDSRPLPHGAEIVRRLRLKQELTAAVYLLTGNLTHEAPERRLLRFRWFEDQPFNAGAQFSDGWAAFLWSGIWEDGPAIDKRLILCTTVFERWGNDRNPCRPGRLIWVVPTRWQSERVWQAVRNSGWERHCAVYVVEDDLLVGDLDLGLSLGKIPPFIMTEKLKPLPKYVDRFLDILAGEQPERIRKLLAVIEQSRAISPAALQEYTRINGSNLNGALSILSGGERSGSTSEGESGTVKSQGTQNQQAGRELIRVLPNGMYIPGKLALSLAGHRDGVRPNVPVSRFNPDHTAKFSKRRFKKLKTTNSLLARFASAGCPVVSGFFCGDGRFKPDGAVWIDEGPYGSGWHYLVNALSARRQRSVVRALRGALSPDRSDGYPILVLCRPDTESLIWRWGRDERMLTVDSSRLRRGPIVGDLTVWLQYDRYVSILSGQRAEEQMKADAPAANTTGRTATSPHATPVPDRSGVLL